MDTTTTRMIWCEICYYRNADDVAHWVYEGRGAAVDGVLRVAAECRSCEAQLQAGTRVVAVTLRHGGPWYQRWEWAYLACEGEEYF
jgi:hypothetical protein